MAWPICTQREHGFDFLIISWSYGLYTGSSFRCRTLWGSSRISRTQHWKLLKLSQSLYHIIILLPFSGKSLTRKWRDARASLVSKCSDPAPPRSRRGLELPPKISSFRGISYSWEAYDSRLKPHGEDRKAKASSTWLWYHGALVHPKKRPGRLSIFCLFCLPRGIRIFSRTGHWTSLKLLHLKEKSIIQLPFSRKCLFRKWRQRILATKMVKTARFLKVIGILNYSL